MIQRVETFNPDGTSEVEEIEVPDPVLTNSQRFSLLPPEKATAILDLSQGLLMHAGVIWEATFAMDNDAPGKEALRPISEVLLEAALPLLDE